MSTSLLAIRASGEANQAEQKRLIERKKILLLLVHQFLIENGYCAAAERLQAETAQMNVLNKFEVADNVDLGLIISEYEAYYELRFDKKPKFIRKCENSNDDKGPARSKSNSTNKSNKSTSSSSSNDGKLPSITGVGNNTAPESDATFGVSGTSLATANNTSNNKKTSSNSNGDEDSSANRLLLLRPPPQFTGDAETRQLYSIISKEIYIESPNVKFQDIIQLDEAKRLLVEAIQLPLKFPSIFTGILRPWRGILLHGPPGTGKTLLAKAVATECQTTFFNISASTLISKWRGDSEKLVRALFDLARYYSPSTIFLDEIDSILTARDGESGGTTEHEASRRMKTELLIQMDGMNSKAFTEGITSSNSNNNTTTANNNNSSSTPQVFVMAASNMPWDLDIALLRRLEKRVLVTLPTKYAREQMLRKHLEDRIVNHTTREEEHGEVRTTVDFERLAEQTEGYSGADIELLCREAAMMPVRRLLKKIEQLPTTVLHLPSQTVHPPPPVATTTSKRNGASIRNISNIIQNQTNNQHAAQEIEQLLRDDPVTMEDLLTALATTKPSASGKVDKYEAWQREFGAV